MVASLVWQTTASAAKRLRARQPAGAVDVPHPHAGLTQGYRPDLRNPGYWLYAGGHAIVHLNALLPQTPARGGGGFDHIALVAHGLVSTRASLQAAGIAFEESPLKGTQLRQVFVKDPLGLKLELNFDLEAEGLLASPSSPSSPSSLGARGKLSVRRHRSSRRTFGRRRPGRSVLAHAGYLDDASMRLGRSQPLEPRRDALNRLGAGLQFLLTLR